MNNSSAANDPDADIIRPWLAYVGPFAFPDGGAAARRIMGVAKTLQSAGFEVRVACGQMNAEVDTPEIFQGIEIFSLDERRAEHLPRFIKHMAYLNMGYKTIAWLNSQKSKPHTIILYSGYSPYLRHLIPWVRKNRVRLVFDAVEWYDPGSILGWLSPYQLNIELAMRLLLPRVGNVFSISTFLHRYYVARGCRSVLMPPTLDVLATRPRTSGGGVRRSVNLVYAGSPGKKDLLNNIIEAVMRLRQVGHALNLSVAGVTASESMKYEAVRSRPLAEMSAGVRFLGRLSHEASMDLVRQADFSVLLRPDARYSRAGFPTKFVESLAVATPVIANLTSDLHRYLKDGVTGFTCAGPGSEDLESVLIRALAVGEEETAAMRERCRALAEEVFDYRVYVTPVARFLQSAKV